METKSSTQSFLVVALLFTSLFAIYSPALHGDFLWDDDAYISENTSLHNVQGLSDIWLKPGATPQYYPLTFTVFWGEYQIWGLKTLGYHVVNVLLHGANAVLLAIVLTQIGLPGAWLAAFLFALHPVQAESVAWMTELKNTLSTFFYLLTLLAFRKSTAKRAVQWPFYAATLVLFACALLSKSVTLTLPFAYLALSHWKKGRTDTRELRLLSPLMLMALGSGAFTTYFEHHIIHSQGAIWTMTWHERLGLMNHAFWFYLGKLLCPVNLSFIYPKWDLKTLSTTWWAGLLLVALFLRGFTLQPKKWSKIPFACLLFFAISLLPALGLTSFYFMRFAYVADHFQYLASMGLFALVSWGITTGLGQLKIPSPKPVVLAVSSLLCLNLALLTFRESSKYESMFSLCQNTLDLNPRTALAHHQIGIEYVKRGELYNAMVHLRTAEALDTSFPQTHLALALLMKQAGRTKEARHQYEEAFRLGVTDPDIVADYNRTR